MKKISLLISAAIFAVAGFMFSGCEEGDDVTEVLAGPTNTWCKMPVKYTTEDDTTTSASLYAYFYYTANSVTITSNLTLKPGLHLVVTRDSDDSNTSFISSLTENTYILKSFLKEDSSDEDEKNEGTEVKDSDSDTSSIHVNGSRAQWASIYWGKSALRQPANQSKTAPDAVLNGTEITDLSSLQNFSLKRLLANYLLSLLDE